MFASVPFDDQVPRVMWGWAQVDAAHIEFAPDLRNPKFRKSQCFKGATSKHCLNFVPRDMRERERDLECNMEYELKI